MKEKLIFEIDKDLKKEFKKYCVNQDKPMRMVLTALIKQAVKEEKR